MFSGNGLEKLGSTFVEFAKLNHQMFFCFLKMIKRPKNEKKFPDKIEPIQNETEKWKIYALNLEKELKQIQNFRIQTKLKKEIMKDLDIYSFSSRTKKTSTSTI